MNKIFRTRKLNEDGFKKVKEFKTTMKEAVSKAVESMPDSREKSIFLTKIEEAMFFGTKALAESPENHTETIEY